MFNFAQWIMDIFFILSGLFLLVFGGDFLLKSAVGFANRMQIPRIIIGMTIVSFATSAPELIVSIKSAIEGHADIALGNVIGSNIANLGLVLSITTILCSIDITKHFYKTDWPIMMISSLLLYVFIGFDGVLGRAEGAILFFFLLLVLVFLFKFNKSSIEESSEGLIDKSPSLFKDISFLAIGGIGLWGGAELLISGSIEIAKQFHVSERIIGITVVSIGTSVPELATSIIAVIKKEKAISLGNLIGSNMFNILAVLGITSIIQPIHALDDGLMNSDIFWMLAVSFLVFPLVFAPKKMKLSWKEGCILLSVYMCFLFSLIYK